MSPDDKLKQEVNSLLVHLRDFDIVNLVKGRYALFNNSSPPIILRESIERVQAAISRMPKK